MIFLYAHRYTKHMYYHNYVITIIESPTLVPEVRTTKLDCYCEQSVILHGLGLGLRLDNI